MDSESLRTASTYLNNLLLARGLLRNSTPIDFVKPSKDSRAQIINLVHDLILREDRSTASREHVAYTLRQLRADETRQQHEIEALKVKREEDARKLVQAQTTERGAREDVKRVEKACKALQEQTARLKTALALVKTQCNNDVRKRDLELARLKTHLQGQQRGNKAAVVAPSITITGGGARRQQQHQQQQPQQAAFDASMRGLHDPEYSLKQETTEFLTTLSQGLSDENDNLIALIRGAVETLRGLLGLPANALKMPDSAIGSHGSGDEFLTNGKQNSNSGMVHAFLTSYDHLSADLEATLAHLKTILTNPNFVPMEEVEVRDEEIERLREGWERMEQRWRDVLVMMQGWRRRMDTGDTINIDDLRRGMGLVSPERERNVKLGDGMAGTEEERSFMDADVSETPRVAGGEDEDESSVLEPPPRLSSAGRDRNSPPKRKRDLMEPPEFFDLRPPTERKASTFSDEALLEDYQSGFEEELEPVEAGSGLSDEPGMTIEDKLNAAAAEAAEAAEAAASARADAQGSTSTSTSAAKSTSPAPKIAKNHGTAGLDSVFSPLKPTLPSRLDLDGAADEQDGGDTLGKMPSAVKRTKIRGRPRKRRSTLSREEMDELVLSAGGGE